MEDDLLSLIPFKLMLIVISHDFKNIKKGLTSTITSLQKKMSYGHNFKKQTRKTSRCLKSHTQNKERSTLSTYVFQANTWSVEGTKT
jgi:hypothetical protein